MSGFGKRDRQRIARTTREVERTPLSPLRRPDTHGTDRGPTVPFVNWSIFGSPSATQHVIPPYGVICLSGASATPGVVPRGDRRAVYRARHPYGAYHDRGQFINSGVGVAFGAQGVAQTGLSGPVLAQYTTETTVTPRQGNLWGTVPDDHRLYPHLPGWRVVSNPIDEEFTETSGLVWVERADVQCGYVKQINDWWENDDEEVYPCNALGTLVYDGSEVWLPEYLLNVYYPNSSSEIEGDKIFHADDVFPVQMIERHDAAASNDFFDQVAVIPLVPWYDDRVGTIKLFSNRGISGWDLPRHWAFADGTDNSVANGGSGVDMRGRFVVGWEDRTGGSVPSHSDEAYGSGDGTDTGGLKTAEHSDEAGSDFNSTSPSLQVADHDNRPPWTSLVFIERIH